MRIQGLVLIVNNKKEKQINQQNDSVIIMQTENTSKNNNIINQCISSIWQICQQLQKYEQNSLTDLDKSVLTYISQRNNLKIGRGKQNAGIVEQGCKQNNIDSLSISGLNKIHDESECALMELEIQMAQFYKTKQLIHEANCRAVRDCLHQSQQPNSIYELCREMINELAKFRDIQDFCIKVSEHKKKLGVLPIPEQLGTQVESYFKKVEDLLSQNSPSDSDSDSDYGSINGGRDNLLLEFIE